MKSTNPTSFLETDDVNNESNKKNVSSTSVTPKRINGKYILSEIGSVLSLDKGFFYTVKELIIRPGESIQTFLQKDRQKLVKPITFVIFCSLIYSILRPYQINHDFLDVFIEGYVQALGLESSALAAAALWLKNNYGYTNIFISTFIAIWIRLFFRKYDYTYFEIVTALIYVLGISTLIYSCFILIEILSGQRLLYWGMIMGYLYTSWSLAHCFNRKKMFHYFKAAIANLLGILSFYFMVILITTSIDLYMLSIN